MRRIRRALKPIEENIKSQQPSTLKQKRVPFNDKTNSILNVNMSGIHTRSKKNVQDRENISKDINEKQTKKACAKSSNVILKSPINDKLNDEEIIKLLECDVVQPTPPQKLKKKDLNNLSIRKCLLTSEAKKIYPNFDIPQKKLQVKKNTLKCDDKINNIVTEPIKYNLRHKKVDYVAMLRASVDSNNSSICSKDKNIPSPATKKNENFNVMVVLETLTESAVRANRISNQDEIIQKLKRLPVYRQPVPASPANNIEIYDFTYNAENEPKIIKKKRLRVRKKPGVKTKKPVKIQNFNKINQINIVDSWKRKKIIANSQLNKNCELSNNSLQNENPLVVISEKSIDLNSQNKICEADIVIHPKENTLTVATEQSMMNLQNKTMCEVDVTIHHSENSLEEATENLQNIENTDPTNKDNQDNMINNTLFDVSDVDDNVEHDFYADLPDPYDSNKPINETISEDFADDIDTSDLSFVPETPQPSQQKSYRSLSKRRRSPWRADLPCMKKSNLFETKQTCLPRFTQEFLISSVNESSPVNTSKNPTSLKKKKIQTSMRSFVESSHQDIDLSHNDSVEMFVEDSPKKQSTPHKSMQAGIEEIDLTPISKTRSFARVLDNITAPQVQKDTDDYFGFNSSISRDSKSLRSSKNKENFNKPSRISSTSIRKLLLMKKATVNTEKLNEDVSVNDEEHMISQSIDGEVTENNNETLDENFTESTINHTVGLFEDENEDDFPKVKPVRHSYTRKMRKKRRMPDQSDHSECESETEEPLQKHLKKKKNQRTRKEEQEAEKWAERFNSMCDEVDQYKLLVE